MTYPTDADVEAMARAIDPEAWDSIDYARRERDQVKSWYLELQEHHAQESLARARAAFSTLPHYLRAVETLERLRSASKHGESRGRSSGSDPVRVAEEASLPDADLIRAVEEREGLIEALDDMVWQFAHRTVIDGKRALSAGVLSALEHAFGTLAWSDPHFVDTDGCQEPGCVAWATCGTPTPDGYKRLCGKHYMEFRALSRAQAPTPEASPAAGEGEGR